MEDRLTLLSVHAHPDDEASKGAATVAKYHAEDVHTVLVCCTGGEEGDLQNPSLREPGGPFHDLTPDAEKVLLAELRPLELAASAALIGFDQVEMLGYRDSGMPDSPSNDHPESFHQADIDEATGRLVAVIRSTRSQVVLTYSDDQRGYPHPDHLRVHDISVLAFERAGDPDWYPDLGAPFQPSKLYYATWSFERMLAVHQALIEQARLVAVRGRLVRPAEHRRTDHDADRHCRLPVGAKRRVAGPRHTDRPGGGLVVRARRRRAERGVAVGGVGARPQPGGADPGASHRERSVRRGPRLRRQ